MLGNIFFLHFLILFGGNNFKYSNALGLGGLTKGLSLGGLGNQGGGTRGLGGLAGFGLGSLRDTSSVTGLIGNLNSGQSFSNAPLLNPVTNNLALLKQTSSLAIVPGIMDVSKLDSGLLNILQSGGPTSSLISFSGTKSVLDKFKSASFGSRESRNAMLIQALKHHAKMDQASALDLFSQMGITEFQSSWSENVIYLKNAEMDTVSILSALNSVTGISRIPTFAVNTYFTHGSPYSYNFDTDYGYFYGLNGSSHRCPSDEESTNWGIGAIGADLVWEQLGVYGENVVVANIDTGVNVEHESLRYNWRETNGWHDASSGRTTFPIDENGHGTHTMGIIVGQTNCIGVAPGAQWIACRACNPDGGCETEAITECMEWIVTNPAPPHVLSVSLGSAELFLVKDFLRSCIEILNLCGIIVLFSYGNSGPVCFSGASPADQELTFAVGSVEKDLVVSDFSSRGPETTLAVPPDYYIKPDVCAPGGKIVSAWFTSSFDYMTLSGTSMACPHAAGVVALMLSYYMTVSGDYYAVFEPEIVLELLKTSCLQEGLSGKDPLGLCDLLCNVNGFPNNYFGNGLVYAPSAIEAFGSYCGYPIGGYLGYYNGY